MGPGASGVCRARRGAEGGLVATVIGSKRPGTSRVLCSFVRCWVSSTHLPSHALSLLLSSPMVLSPTLFERAKEEVVFRKAQVGRRGSRSWSGFLL